jgi:hypothetical protein
MSLPIAILSKRAPQKRDVTMPLWGRRRVELRDTVSRSSRDALAVRLVQLGLAKQWVHVLRVDRLNVDAPPEGVGDLVDPRVPPLGREMGCVTGLEP